MGTAVKNKGVQELLDAIVAYFPARRPPDRGDRPVGKPRRSMETEPPRREELDSRPRSRGAQGAHHLVQRSARGMAFKTVVETFGQLTYFRVYQGKIAKGESYTNQRTGKKVRFGRLVRMHADQREDVESAEAGDIVAAVGVDCALGRYVLRQRH